MTAPKLLEIAYSPSVLNDPAPGGFWTVTFERIVPVFPVQTQRFIAVVFDGPDRVRGDVGPCTGQLVVYDQAHLLRGSFIALPELKDTFEPNIRQWIAQHELNTPLTGRFYCAIPDFSALRNNLGRRG